MLFLGKNHQDENYGEFTDFHMLRENHKNHNLERFHFRWLEFSVIELGNEAKIFLIQKIGTK